MATIKTQVNKYMKQVLSGKVTACEYVKLAVQRHLDDLEHGKERGLWFDENAALEVIGFFKLLKHSKGKWAGEPFVMEPWQLFIKWVVYGWMRADGTRRFRESYREIARKNGKSTELAGECLNALGFDGEAGAEVYSVATKEEQARITFNEGSRMAAKSDNLGGYAEVYKKSIVVDYSSWRPLGKDSKYQDGLNPHFVAIDEYHAHPDSSMYDVMDSAIGARSQPMLSIITTAGFNKQSACYQKRDYAVKVLEGTIKDDSYFAIIYTLDEGDKWDDEKVWPKANPNLGVSVSIEDMRRMCAKAKESPTSLNNFLTKKLNVWTTQEVKWIDMLQWEDNDSSVPESLLVGKECYAGLDLASTNDITAFVLVFPWHNDTVVVVPRFWIPKDNAQKRIRKDRVPYDKWAADGYVKMTPGNVIDYSIVMNDILKDCARFDMKLIGFDRWGFEAMRQRMMEFGLPEDKLLSFGQGYASMSAPCKEIERLYLSEKLIHNNNPVLSWMASNVQATNDPAGNIKMDKSKSSEKIDGMVGLAMGLGVKMTQDVETDSIYESRGFVEIDL